MPVPPRLAVKTPLTRPGQQCGAASRRGGRAAVDAPVSFLLEVEPDKPHDVRLGGQIGHQVRDPGRLRAACFTGGGLRDEDRLSGGDAAELGDAESKQILRRDPAGHKIVDVLPGTRVVKRVCGLLQATAPRPQFPRQERNSPARADGVQFSKRRRWRKSCR